jgi:hypothetical protein
MIARRNVGIVREDAVCHSVRELARRQRSHRSALQEHKK